jgi:hypothetical protein
MTDRMRPLVDEPRESMAGENPAGSAGRAPRGIDEQNIVVGTTRVRADIATPHGLSMYGEVSSRGSSELPQAPDAPGSPATFESFEQAATEINPRQTLAAEQATPTEIDPQLQRSEPIRVFSMKAQTDAEAEAQKPKARVPLHAQLRSMAEVARRHDTPAHGLGYLARPRDPAQPAHPHRGVILRVAIAVALACTAALAIWLVAG